MKFRSNGRRQRSPNMTLIGILLGIAFWVIDPLIDSHLLSGGSYWNQIINPDSQEIWLRFFVSFVFLSFGVYAEHISARRRRIERTMMESEEKFRLLYEDAPLGYQSLNETGNILKVNQAWLKLVGYSEDEVIGRWFGDFLDEESKTNFKKRFPVFKVKGEVHGVEFNMIKKDGTLLPVSFDGRVSCKSNGEFRQTHCIMHDNTERKRTEEILRRGEARFRALAELLPETVIETDRKGNLTFINCHALNKFKYSAEDFQKGLNIFQIVAPEDRERAINNFEKVLGGERSQNNEYTVLRKDASSVEVELYSAPIIQNGEAVGIRGIAIDISERKNAEIVLRLSEERFRTIADFTFGWEDLISPAGSLMWTNPSVERITGYSPKECLAMPNYPVQLIVEEDREQAMDAFAKASAGNWMDDFTFRIRRKDGQIIWLAVVAQPVFDSEGKHIGTRASLRDISRQKEAEDALKESEEKYRTLMGQASDGIFVTDTTGRCLDINTSGCTMLGHSREEALCLNITDLVHPDDLERLIPSGLQGLEAGRHIISEVRIKLKDGTYLEAEISAKKLPDGRFQGIIRDIGERKKAEKAIHESEQRFRLGIENYPGAAIILDADRRMEFANHFALNFTGLTLERALGRTESEVLPAEMAESYLPLLLRAYETGQPQAGEFVFGSDSSAISIDMSFIPLLDEQGIVCQVFAFGHDISERKRAEEELRESKERYRNLYNSAYAGLIRTRISDGLILECNDCLAHILGYESRLELINKLSITNFWPGPEVRQAFLDNWRPEGEIKDIELKLRRLDGSEFWARISARADWNKGYIEGALVDITDRKRSEEQIIKLSQAVEQSPVTVVLTDLEGNIEYINQKFTDLTGYSRDEVLGKNPRILKSGLTPEEEYGKLWKAITAGGQWQGEFRNKKKNGDLFWEKASISPIKDSKGRIAHYLGIKEDITDRKRIEEALRRSESFLQTTFDAIQDGISVLDKDLNIVRANEALERWYAHMLPLIGKKCYQAYNQRQEHCEICPSVRALETGAPQMNEVPMIGADGQVGWQELYAFPLFDDEGNCSGVVEYVRNITERKRAEDAVAESEAKFRTLFEYSVDGIFLMTDLFLDCNEQACRMWACERDDIVGHSPVEFSPEFQPDGRRSDESAKDKIDSALSGNPQRFYWKHLRKDGTLIDTEVALKAITVNDKKVIQATVRDITDRMHGDEALRSSEERFRRIFRG